MTDREQLVEKVARAIYESHPAYQGTARVYRIEWDQARHGISGTECYRQARAAIAAIYEAMREPSDDMLDAGGALRMWCRRDCTIGAIAAGRAYRAMLEVSPLKGE